MLLGLVIKPLQARQRDQREEVGQADRARRRHRRRAARPARDRRRAGVLRPLSPPLAGRAASPAYGSRCRSRRSTPPRCFIPGLFVVFVTWLGARFAVSGQIETGELVAFYGYAAFLVIPLRTAAEAVDKVTRSLVGARRMLSVLAVERHVDDPEEPAAEPPAGVGLADPRSGLVIRPGELLCLVSAEPAETRRARRPARPLRRRGRRRCSATSAWPTLPVETVRRRIVVSEADPVLFAGTLRTELDPLGRSNGQDDRILEAIGVANAEDILDALPEGLDAEVEERGRSFSGGQRQRLVLARALLTDAEMLVLVEPTSAVDAHTEARIAAAPARSAHRPDDRDRDDEPARARPGGPRRR